MLLTLRTVRRARKSVGAGVLQAVLGQLAVAPVLAVADAEFEGRIVGVALAALRADARLAWRGGERALSR